MINIKYSKLYDKFIEHYKDKHVNPWHEMSENELEQLYNKLISDMDVNDDYSFNYFINYILKRLCGKSDAHTKCVNRKRNLLPLSFKCVDNEIYIVSPKELYGANVCLVNNMDINKIIDELEDIITYGTDGKRMVEIETALSNKYKLFSLPSMNNAREVLFKLALPEGRIIEKKYFKEEIYDVQVNPFIKNAKYELKKDTLIYYHSSLQPGFKEKIEEAIKKLETEDLSNINKIIIDLRGNTGGNSTLNQPLIDFLKKHLDKQFITLTDYRVFSGGRYALLNLIDLGSITIGEEISTPINCYGNSNWLIIDDYAFSASERYLYPGKVVAKTKEEFKKIPSELLKPIYFYPDIYVKNTAEDLINEKDTIMEMALKLSSEEVK